MDWKVLKLYGEPTDYMISEYGDICNLHTNKIIKTFISNSGYVVVRLKFKKHQKNYFVHRLVGLNFIGDQPEGKPQINHIDGIKTNNHVSNLEWVSASENNKKAYEIGLKPIKYGDESHLAQYKRSDVIKACELMEGGITTLQDISLITGISIEMLYNIRYRHSWVNISSNYDIQNCKQTNHKYTDEQMLKVFELLSENKLSLYDISDITGVRVSTITNVLLHRDCNKFSYMYELYDISKYNGRKNISALDSIIVDDIDKLLSEGISNKKIVEIVYNKYNINKDKILHTVQRRKKKVQRLSNG